MESGLSIGFDYGMHPTLIDIADVRLQAYPLLVGFAFVLCTLLIVRDCRKEGLDLPPTAALAGLVGALFGAKLLYCLEYSQPLWRSVLLWQGGYVYYGGLVTGTLAVLLLLRLHNLPLLRTADIVAPYLALGEAIGRIGCFLNGCCWGAPCTLSWAVRFSAGSLAFQQQVRDGLLDPSSAASLPVHPTQLYAAVGLLLIFGALRIARNRNSREGAVALLYLFLNAIVRFGMEVFRADSARPFFHMTIAQGMCVLIVVLTLALAILTRTRAIRE